jgi:uncharacterized membrane protein
MPHAETSLVVAAGLISAYQLIRKRPMVAAATTLGAVGLVAIQRNTENAEQERAFEATANFAIRCSPQRAYEMWRDFENLPRFMPHLESVTVRDKLHSHWKAGGPFGSNVSWDAEIVDEVENQRITWRSLPGSTITNRGSMEFHPGPTEDSVIATLRMWYSLPGGTVGKAFATMFGRDPEFTVREDLRRFKSFVETGEIATTTGQPHGPRGLHGRLMHRLLRETSNMAEPGITAAPRRAA